MTEPTPETAPRPTDRSGFEFNQPTIVALCYIASALTAFPMLIGLVLAYIWKGSPAAPWEDSHFRFHIRSQQSYTAVAQLRPVARPLSSHYIAAAEDAHSGADVAAGVECGGGRR